MTPITILAREPLFHRLGLTLLHFLWQGALVAALYAALRAVVPSSRARARYAAGCLALTAMLALPGVTFWKMSTTVHDTRLRVDSAKALATPTVAAERLGAGSSTTAWPTLGVLRDVAGAVEPWLVLAWIGGVALLSARFLLGWAAVGGLRRRWTTEAPAELVESLRELARRLRISRPVQLLLSAAVRVPTAFGVLRPVILLPLSSLSGLSAAEIEAMLAHELAHIRRQDYLINWMQTLAETLLFYHPAVWWLGAAIRAERENCCDDIAVAVTGDARRYARALLRLEQTRVAAPQFAVAANGSALSRRVARLLPARRDENLVARSAAALIAVAALTVLASTAERASLPSGEDETTVPIVSLSELTRKPVARPESKSAPARVSRNASAATPARSARPVSLREGPSPSEASEASEPSEASNSSEPAEPSTMDAEDPAPAAAAKGRSFSSDQLEQFRIHGVTPEFIRDVEALGYQSASPDTLLSLRIHGVAPDFIREINEIFGRRLSLDECVSLRIHGVGPSYARAMFTAFGKLSADDVQSLRIHGVSAEYLQSFREAGYSALTAEEAIEMRIHGVDPSGAAEFVRLGFSKPTLSDLEAARIHGVSAEYVRGIREEGLKIQDLDGMISLRNHGVTPEFVHAMREIGFSTLSADQAIDFRNHGVTPEFVRAWKAIGYADLSADDLVELRNHGATPEWARKANTRSHARLSVDDLIELRDSGRSEP